MRKKIIAGNWKMNNTASQTAAFLSEFKGVVAGADADVVFGIPAINIPAALQAVEGSNVKIAAQNMHFEESGAFTGEISAAMLKDLGVEYVILGHSERRQYFAETDETVNKKTLKAHEAGITPIVCVGELLEQREQGVTFDLVRLQTKIALKGLTPDQVKATVIAYEPVWAIGTGRTATSEQAEEVCADIRNCIAEVYGQDVADEVRIQYGGSVSPANANELFHMPNIDGGLVGGASLKMDFEKVVKYNG